MSRGFRYAIESASFVDADENVIEVANPDRNARG